ncbi:MAG: glycosyltransferase family 2 protein [Bacteroidia bacterium]
MKVSIITVCYNSEATIEETIRSVVEQNHPGIEYIVVDGKSTDKTLAIIEKYRNKISKLVSEKDNGIYFALNKGLQLATGDIAGILHSDDFYTNSAVISRVVKEFETKNCDSVYGDLQYVSREDISKVTRHWKSDPFDAKRFLKGWMPPHPTFFVKRKFYAQFGLFNTVFSSAGDYELMLRFLYKHRITSSYIPEVLVKMRTGGVSNVSFSNRLKANREDRLAWTVNGLKPAAFTLTAKPFSKLKQFFKRGD